MATQMGSVDLQHQVSELSRRTENVRKTLLRRWSSLSPNDSYEMRKSEPSYRFGWSETIPQEEMNFNQNQNWPSNSLATGRGSRCTMASSSEGINIHQRKMATTYNLSITATAMFGMSSVNAMEACWEDTSAKKRQWIKFDVAFTGTDGKKRCMHRFCRRCPQCTRYYRGKLRKQGLYCNQLSRRSVCV